MANVVIMLVLVLFVFGVSFGVTHSYPVAGLFTAVLALGIVGLVAWIRRHPVKWATGTRVWVALAFAMGCAGFGVVSIVIDPSPWPTGVLCLTAAAASAISAATIREADGARPE